MRGLNAGELAVGVTALAALAGFAFWHFLLWIKNSPVHPDPWDDATEQAVRQPDAVPVCHHCLTQVPPGQWFCETCGCAVGPYNNYMPYVNCFSEGEVFRNGVTARMSPSVMILAGYFFITLGGLMHVLLPNFLLTQYLGSIITLVYAVGAVIFCRLVSRNLFHRPSEGEQAPLENPAG